ncbi:MAG TPA: phosphoethanolamine--lipid A transferase EptA [Steroidobacteraceae bacterium]|nr:phosphoethanolamine--lipid A transferase EptA [Steroidobacteraceae bacterium]
MSSHLAAASDRLRRASTATAFIAVTALVNALLYHLPLFSFAARNLDLSSFTGDLTLATLAVVVVSETFLAFALLAVISDRLLKPFCMLFAAGNAIAVYFLVTYQVVLDETMMGNVLNTDFAELSGYLHPTLIVYLLALGALPCWLLARVRILGTPRSHLAALALACLAITVVWCLLASRTWLWFDENSKRVGGMVMPWSYVINTGRYLVPRLMAPRAQEPLPPAIFSSAGKTVVILVIGEAARAQSFQLYGYDRPTNPLLSKADVVALKNATACATYTTAAVRCILSNVDPGSPFSKRYEPLPSYLQRNGVDVIWRTGNWGEPPIKVQTYQTASDLSADCAGARCGYDEVLLSGLEQRIRASSSQRVFVVLHQSGSHGPAYYTKYPGEFEYFKPVCRSVELGRCTHDELVNAYDNTILYEDYFLFRVIGVLGQLQDTATLLIYVSDHGESLGEYGMYLHGIPYAIAPDVQKAIPFIIWMSDEFIRRKAVHIARLESQRAHSQRDVFHTVMGAFSMRSDAYLGEYDIFSGTFSDK